MGRKRHSPEEIIGNLREKTVGGRTVELRYWDGSNGTSNNGRLRGYKGRYQGGTTGGAWRDFGYDSRGNVTGDHLHSWIYDLTNRPTRVTTRTGAADPFTSWYLYDGHGRRVKQARTNGQNGSGSNTLTAYSVYGLDGTLIHRDVTENGVRTRTDYVRLGGEPIARIENGTPTYVHNDHLGSPVAETDRYGRIIASSRVDTTPYGEVVGGAASAWDDDAGFTGHVKDADTDLTYMQARYYNPIVGRFYANDPVGFGPLGSMRPSMFGRYHYAANDPMNLIDPTGECPWCIAGAVFNGGMQLYREGRSGQIGRNVSFGSNMRALGRVALASGTGALGVGVGARVTGLAATTGGRVISGAVGGATGSTISETGVQVGEVSAGRATATEATGSVGKAAVTGAVAGGFTGAATPSGISIVDQGVTGVSMYSQNVISAWGEAQASEMPAPSSEASNSGVTVRSMSASGGGRSFPPVDPPCIRGDGC